jgi:DNA-binding NtrC family response regulator
MARPRVDTVVATMGKINQKSKILWGENDAEALAEAAAMMKKAGYAITQATGRKEIEAVLGRERFDLVILGHTLSKNDRHHLPYMAKKADEATRVLVLHASGRHHAVDKALDSRDGDHVVLEAVAELLALIPVGA